MNTTFLLLLAVPAALAAQQPDLTAVADSVFRRWSSTNGPGCAVGVAREGRVLLTRGYGLADLETGRPVTPETIFESGSVAKQFTVTAVLLLARDGKLDLDDPVRRYIPELPDYGRPLTIRHLLTHTSGLREWSALVAVQGWPRGSRAHEQAQIIELVTRQRALNYPVGDYYSYTNSGYILAAALVERVSGRTLQEFTDERIFRPLGMLHTRWRDDFTRLVPGRAQAYGFENRAWHLNMPFENVIGPGGLLTTVGDWLLWNGALSNRTLGAAVVDSMYRRMRLTSGREIQYALGLFFTTYRGVPEISHGGATAGYTTFLARYPDRGSLSVAVMCNAAGANAAALAHAMADAIITDFPPSTAPDTAAVSPADLARFAGVYRGRRAQGAYTVSPQVLARFRALPNGWLWLPDGSRWRFEAGADGRPAGFRVAQPDGDTVAFAYAGERAWSPAAQQLAEFEASYRSEEVGATYTVKVVNDTLTLSPRPGVVVRLTPTYQDGFADGGAVWFTRDRRGNVTAMHFGQSRMWDLVLERVR